MTGPSIAEYVYMDSSALVKLLVQEPETAALKRELAQGVDIATSRLAVVEVTRAAALVEHASQTRVETDRLLSTCFLVQVDDQVLASARELASSSLRTLDAIHLASALYIEPTKLISYDKRLIAAATRHGLAVSHPGLKL